MLFRSDPLSFGSVEFVGAIGLIVNEARAGFVISTVKPFDDATCDTLPSTSVAFTLI